MTEHERFVREAVSLSREALARGDGPYGAVLVRHGEVVARARNTTAADGDCTRHAELNLLVDAQTRLDADALAECVLYTSTEPCAMCAGAVHWAGVGRVVFGCSVERQVAVLGGGLAIPCRTVFAASDRRIDVAGPVLEDEAAAVLAESVRQDER